LEIKEDKKNYRNQADDAEKEYLGLQFGIKHAKNMQGIILLEFSTYLFKSHHVCEGFS
jgi:hypothetical protein